MSLVQEILRLLRSEIDLAQMLLVFLLQHYVRARIKGCKINLIARQSWDQCATPSGREYTQPEPRPQ